MAGAKVNAAIRTGEWYRLFTPLFLHGNTLHLIVNLSHRGCSISGRGNPTMKYHYLYRFFYLFSEVETGPPAIIGTSPHRSRVVGCGVLLQLWALFLDLRLVALRSHHFFMVGEESSSFTCRSRLKTLSGGEFGRGGFMIGGDLSSNLCNIP